MSHAKTKLGVGVEGGLTRVTGEVFDVQTPWSGWRWEMALRPPRMNAGEGSQGTESVFWSHFQIIVFFSPRRQPVDLPVLQAFFPSNTDRRESMRTPVTATVANLHWFRHYKPRRGLFKGHSGHTNKHLTRNTQWWWKNSRMCWCVGCSTRHVWRLNVWVKTCES